MRKRPIHLVLQLVTAANMRYLAVLFLWAMSQFVNGQTGPRVITKFDKVVMYEDFSYVTNLWEQKNSGSESFIISDKHYTIERSKNTFFSISLPVEADPVEAFELSTAIKVLPNKQNKRASGGVVLKAQKVNSDALVLEINVRREYRFSLLKGGEKQYISQGKEGWVKSSNLKTDDFNEIKVLSYGNVFDIYFNGQFETSFIEATLTEGLMGFYADASSTIVADFFILKTKIEKPSILVVESPTPQETKEVEDPTYKALAQAFTAKFDKQQEEIQSLKQELHECKSALTYDTTSQRQAAEFKVKNAELNQRIQQLENQLKQAEQRMTYLETLKSAVESDVNGDLILQLTQFLSDERDKNAALKKKISDLESRLAEQH